MSLTTDLTYIHNVSHKLRNFKKKKDYLYNFSCPICGDSKTKRTKARGYFYRVQDRMLFRCHNCGASTTFSKVLQKLDEDMYKRYVFERYSHGEEKKTIHETVDYEPVKIRQTSVLDTVKTVARLSDNHPVKKYLEGRKIPTEHWNDLYLVNQFCTFVNKIIPNKFPNVDQDHPRLVIPFRDKTGKLVGFQGRAFGKEKPKYLTIMLEEAPKIFGLDKVNMSDVVYVVEGPIDSLFVDNSIAMAGADISVYEIYPTAKFVYIYDNEPRNPEIVKRMNKVIERGDSIVVWPNNIGEKDINDMIIAGKSKSDVFDIISRNTQNGLSAKIKFTEWKKCE